MPPFFCGTNKKPLCPTQSGFQFPFRQPVNLGITTLGTWLCVSAFRRVCRFEVHVKLSNTDISIHEKCQFSRGVKKRLPFLRGFDVAEGAVKEDIVGDLKARTDEQGRRQRKKTHERPCNHG